MKRQLLISLLLLNHCSAATLEWTGNGDGASFFQEANWQIQGGGAIAGNPLAPSVTINDDLIFTGTNPNISSELKLAASTTLTNNAGTLVMTNSGGMDGGTITVSNNGSIQSDWINNSTINLSQSNITLRGDGNPLNNSTISCTGNAWTISFTAETSADVQTEHLSKITINGQPAVVGGNCSLTAQGNGATLAPAHDSDNDGLTDTWEQQYFGDLDETAAGDPDGDQLTNLDEVARGTSPILSDTDGDNYSDKVETGTGIWVSNTDTGTDALSTDTDKDGLPDGVESNTGTFTKGSDTGTNPHLFNSDNDRLGDGAEVARGTDPTNASSQPDLPNVIFIMADDLGYNHLSSYGQTRLATPNIDLLATQGIKFTDAYAGCTVCGPSRSSLMTGIHSGHIPYKPNVGHVDITSRTRTVAEVFKQAGYMTGMFGKWGIGGLGSGQTPNDRGFDTFYGMLDQGHGHRHFPSYLLGNNIKQSLGNTVIGSQGNTSSNPAHRVKHTHDAFTENALQFIEDQKDKAFFCYLSFTLPHTEIIASDAVLNTPEFDPALWPETYTANTSAHIAQSQPHRNFGAEIRMIDNSVGAIVAKLEDPNGDGNTSDSITNNTLLIFTSDNGGQLQAVWGSAPSIYFNANGILRGGKEDSYEGGLRVPMVAKWPGKIAPNTSSNLPTYFADFLPTVCELVSIKPPKYTDGLSIAPTLKGNTADQKIHPYLFWSHQAGRLDHAVRAGKWKAVKRGNNSIELYNLETDPSEANNIAGSNPTITAEMLKIITREYKTDLPDPMPSLASPKYPNHP